MLHNRQKPTGNIVLFAPILVMYLVIAGCGQGKLLDPTLTPIPMINDDYGVPMVLIPDGSFDMGADADTALAECQKFYGSCSRDWYTSEEPIHRVFLDNYYIDQYEVTNARYAACVDEGVCDPPIVTDDLSRGEYYGSSTYADYPVIFVKWYDAQTYCQWRGARLPTEAEWEKAARGRLEGKLYPWGDTFDGERVNFCDRNCKSRYANQDYDDGYENTAPVGSYAPNGYGLYDMAGNVWEWVADWYDKDYYAHSPASNPGGPASGERRVLRGGSWYNFGSYYRAAHCYSYDPSNVYSIVGFRCASSP
jgi:formylglycine-generating enzyme required for sulfatase activity